MNKIAKSNQSGAMAVVFILLIVGFLIYVMSKL